MQTMIPCDTPLGRSLRRWRAMRRMKQSHVAELAGVSQATVSRWEAGALTPSAAEQRMLRRLMGARLDSAADHALARLVRSSSRPMHLVCDLTHRLLAASASRERQWRRPLSEFLGASLWRYASPEIAAAEAGLPSLGWFEADGPTVELASGPNGSAEVPIAAGRIGWSRLQLSDGAFARLVEALG
jgi:transcriptional regulator with XRE-family HTH domain